MWMEQHLKIIADIDNLLLTDLVNEFLQVDWTNAEFDWPKERKFFINGRLCEFPFIVVSKKTPPSETKQKLLDCAKPIVEFLQSQRPNDIFIRGELAVLPPGAVLDKHIDPRWFHKHGHRLHIPVYTNDKAKLIFEDLEYHLPIGKIYEINNRVLHTAKNDGLENRLHLIFDVIDRDIWEHNSNTDRFAHTPE